MSSPTSQDAANNQSTVAGFLALFTSTGTLLCCALPSAIAAVAGGSAVVSFVSTFPWLVPLSRHKEWIFLIAGVMVLISGLLTYRPKGKVACSLTGGKGCAVAGRFTKAMFWTSSGIYAVGIFSAYVLLPVIKLTGG